MNELSLFSGAGGGLLGTKLLGWRCIGYVEIEKYCQKVLAQRIKDGFLDRAPIFGDIREFNTHWARRYRGLVGCLTAGFPCQPFSTAGKQLGADDPRNMWPATIACIRLVRPRYCLLENVPGLLASGYFGTILGDLAKSGYDARWQIMGADAVGALHHRARLWLVAHAQSDTITIPNIPQAPRRTSGVSQPGGSSDDHIPGAGRAPSIEELFEQDDDLAGWVGEVSAIGNGQVPAVAAAAWNLLSEAT